MTLRTIIHVTRCWTGRRWINIGSGWLAIGFGPRRFIERVHVARRRVYAA